MSDKNNIEKFFEERLSGKHFVFRESDWEMMEQKLEASQLNKENPSGFFRRKWLLISSALIFAFFLGWYGNKISDNLENEKVKSSESFEEVDPYSPVKNKASGDKLTTIKADGEVKEQTKTSNKKSGDFIEDIKPVKAFEQPTKATTSNTAGNISFIANEDQKSHIPASAAVPVISSSPDFVDGKKEMILLLKEPEDHGTVILFQPANKDSVTKTDLKQYKFSIGLSYAPDLTSAGFFNQQQLAQSFGIQLYYQLTKKWILQTGINYVKKKYEAEPDNYQPYENYWDKKTHGYVPDDIFGNCSVIDVPVNITYQWSTSGKFSFLTTAGFSNYFLLDEEYFYEFNNYPNSSYGWNTTENSKFIGGIINASFGLSIKVNERTNVQLEPYLKIPVKNIGYGNLRLFSTGSFFTIKYDIY
jgi:hypothetical protein